MKTKFTKGPWEIEQCDLPITKSEYFDVNTASGQCVADTYYKYDAHLIASAPDIYKMLDEIAINMHKTDSGCIQDIISIELLLAKARGEQA